MFDRQGRWRVTTGAVLMLGLLASSALAQVAPRTPPSPPVAPDPMPPNGEPVAAPQPLVPGLANYKAVTAERLKQPEDSDWLMFRRTYDGWGYSPLIADHHRQCRQAAPGLGDVDRTGRGPSGAADGQQRRHVRGHAGQPGARHQRQDRRSAVAFQAADPRGPVPAAPDQPWRRTVGRQGVSSRPPTPRWWRWTRRPASRSGHQSRGLREGLLHVAGAVGRSTARCWSAPRAANSAFAAYVAAFDAETGKELWRTYTIPAPGEPGSETWPKGDAVEDRRRFGVDHRRLRSGDQPDLSGGPAIRGPWMGDKRPGDNLYTTSVMALDAATGKIKGHSPVPPEQFMGLGRSVAADHRRLSGTADGR